MRLGREAEGLLQYSLPKAHKTRCKVTTFISHTQARGHKARTNAKKRKLFLKKENIAYRPFALLTERKKIKAARDLRAMKAKTSIPSRASRSGAGLQSGKPPRKRKNKRIRHSPRADIPARNEKEGILLSNEILQKFRCMVLIKTGETPSV